MLVKSIYVFFMGIFLPYMTIKINSFNKISVLKLNLALAVVTEFFITDF